jgi:hypothetical protein
LENATSIVLKSLEGSKGSCEFFVWFDHDVRSCTRARSILSCSYTYIMLWCYASIMLFYYTYIALCCYTSIMQTD